jgi:hypothetical protein
MRAGLSFSRSSISLLLRQPLSIKKSYAGAIHTRTDFIPQNKTLEKGRKTTSIHKHMLNITILFFAFEADNNVAKSCNVLEKKQGWCGA